MNVPCRSPGAARAAGTLCAVLLAALAAPLAAPLVAQEFTGLMGVNTASGFTDPTYAWKLEYRQGLGEHFEFSFGWLNEGHFEGHHRDGHTLSFWARQNIAGGRISLALGAGAMRYYDTQDATDSTDYLNVHGWAGITSFDAAYYFRSRWIIRYEMNRTWAGTSTIDTWNLLLGVGYQLQAPSKPGPRDWPEQQANPTTRNEVTAYVGRTILNSFNSQQAVAGQIEYRRGLSRYIDASASVIYEGAPVDNSRGGILLELWAGRTFFNEKFELAIGAGPYFAFAGGGSDSTSGSAVLGMITPSFSYRFGDHWLGRFSWNRTFTNFDKDTDVFMLGVGYRFP
jgi:hypothetical protein